MSFWAASHTFVRSWTSLILLGPFQHGYSVILYSMICLPGTPQEMKLIAVDITTPPKETSGLNSLCHFRLIQIPVHSKPLKRSPQLKYGQRSSEDTNINKINYEEVKETMLGLPKPSILLPSQCWRALRRYLRRIRMIKRNSARLSCKKAADTMS